MVSDKFQIPSDTCMISDLVSDIYFMSQKLTKKTSQDIIIHICWYLHKTISHQDIILSCLNNNFSGLKVRSFVKINQEKVFTSICLHHYHHHGHQRLTGHHYHFYRHCHQANAGIRALVPLIMMVFWIDRQNNFPTCQSNFSTCQNNFPTCLQK